MNATAIQNANNTQPCFRKTIDKHEPGTKIGFIERFAFYERAKKAYCVVMTGETALYANIILKKGVVVEK